MSSDPLLDSLLADAAGMLLSTPGSTPPPTSVPSSGAALPAGGSALGSTLDTVSDKLFFIVCVDCGDPRVCFGNVGVGSVFCVRKDCGVKSHQGAKSAFAGTGVNLVFIKRNSSSENVFTEPSVPWDQIPEEVRMEWFSTSYSLPRWIQEFQAVTLVDNVEATSDEVKREISFFCQGRGFQDAI